MKSEIKEQIIKLETTKLLKEKGINLNCETLTQSLVQKWLREVHGINIFMCFKPNIKKWDFVPYDMKMTGMEYVKYNSEYLKSRRERRYDTYEDALENGIVEALNMIKTPKKLDRSDVCDNNILTIIEDLLKKGDINTIADIMTDYNSKVSKELYREATKLIDNSDYKEEIDSLIRGIFGIFG